MAKVCQITGRRPASGNNVSHAKNKTRRRFLPNLHKRRIWIPSEERYITLRVSARGLRTIDKLGIEAALKKIKNNEDIN
jgi:large subunit ribosomal protein L28